MAIHCFYHKVDWDGKCSAAIVNFAVGTEESPIIFHGCNYNGMDFRKEMKDVTKDDDVYVVDVHLDPMEVMVELKEKCKKLIWIDHHISAIKQAHDLNFYCDGALNVNYAACELTWMYFNSDKPSKDIPYGIYCMGRYDVWDLEADPGIVPFHYGMDLRDPSKPTNSFWKILFDENTSDVISDHIISNGEIAEKYHKVHCKRVVDAASFVIEFEGLRCLVANVPIQNSHLFDSKWNVNKHDAMMTFWMDQKNKWRYSLYTTKKDIDVSKIAMKYGGGGHACAAGFMADELVFKMEE